MAKKNKGIVYDFKFEGGAFAFIGVRLMMLLVVLILAAMGFGVAYAIGAFEEDAGPLMLGIGIALIALPTWMGLCWGIVSVIKHNTSNTKIDGRSLTFTGSGFGLFMNTLKWLFLIVITVGLYLFWLPVKVKKWRMKHTEVVPKEEDDGDYGYGQPEINFYEYDEEYEYDDFLKQ